jgi:phosphoglucomutase
MAERSHGSPVDPFPGPGCVNDGPLPQPAERERFLAGTLISFSGWRRIFAADGGPESLDPRIDRLCALFSASAAAVFVRRLSALLGGRPPRVAVAEDTRPTSPAVAKCVIRALLAEGASVRCLSVAPTPEAMAATAASRSVDGLIVVTASHNPVGHNGFKFAAADGQVLSPEEHEVLRRAVFDLFRSDRELAGLQERLAALPESRVLAVYSRAERNKAASLAAYRRLIDRVAAMRGGRSRAESVRESLRRALELRPFGVVAELNGSARACSIDADYLSGLGVRVRVKGGTPGLFGHAILPEGDSLLPACRALEQAAEEDPCFELGYVPDCDGDRGNLVILEEDRRARPLEAQEVFALSVAAELSFLKASGVVSYDSRGNPSVRLGVVVNGCTSGRIERLADLFGATVFRAEVGEANVLELAGRLQREGWLIRIVGEGSNGGNITWPSKVRDPLSSVLGIVKILRLECVMEAWRERCGDGASRLTSGAGLAALVRSIPRYYSTGQYERRSMVQLRTRDQGRLKDCYEQVLARRWKDLADELRRRLGVVGYRLLNYEGIRAVPGPGGRSGDAGGGLKVSLVDGTGREAGFLWIRGSRTEPVFRIMADASTSAGDERYLLNINRTILLEADSHSGGC